VNHNGAEARPVALGSSSLGGQTDSSELGFQVRDVKIKLTLRRSAALGDCAEIAADAYLDRGVMVNDLLTYKAHVAPGFDHTRNHAGSK
jgi:hypothetical protein